MSQQNPYEVNYTPHVQIDYCSQASLAGVIKAFAIWGGVFLLTCLAMICVRFDKGSQRYLIEMPNQQDFSFYVMLGGIIAVCSVLSWGLGCIADLLGRTRLIVSQVVISILLILMTVPGLISLNYFGICWNTIRKTLMFLIPTFAYTSSRTKRWTRRARSAGFDLR